MSLHTQQQVHYAVASASVEELHRRRVLVLYITTRLHVNVYYVETRMGGRVTDRIYKSPL